MFVLIFTTGASSRMSGDGGLLEQYSLVSISAAAIGDLAEDEMKSLEEFQDAVEQVFYPNELARNCDTWHKECTGETSSPWTKYSVTDADLVAINGLCFDSDRAEDLREEMAQTWSESNPEFDDYSQEEQYNLLKNACAVELVSQVNDYESE